MNVAFGFFIGFLTGNYFIYVFDHRPWYAIACLVTALFLVWIRYFPDRRR